MIFSNLTFAVDTKRRMLREYNTGTGISRNYKLDEHGNMTYLREQFPPEGEREEGEHWVTYYQNEYDSSGRLVLKKMNGDLVEKYEYDGAGRLIIQTNYFPVSGKINSITICKYELY